MKLRQLRVRNFRCFCDEAELNLGDFTALVGKNDSGKSTALQALATFFGEYKPDQDDACNGGDKSDVRIVCEFEDLPETIVIDANHSTTLACEHLLNEQGRLEIHQVFNGGLKTPKRTAVLARALHPGADGCTDLLHLKNAELKARADHLDVDLGSVDQRVNAEIRAAIYSSIGDLQLSEREIDLEKEDAKKIWSVLERQLPAFAIFYSDRKSSDQDEEAQDPMKAAIAEALKTRQDELDALAEHVRGQVVEIAKATVAKLSDMDPRLARELNPRFSTPNWASVFKVSLTDNDQVPVNKRGSGVRRLILLNFFRAKAEKRLRDGEAPSIIYAIEEPETSQHPSNQELLFSVLRELSEQPGCQVVVTTHTPVLVRHLPLDCLQYADPSGAAGPTIRDCDETTYPAIARSLGVVADHDVKAFVGVEGVNDIDFLKGISSVLIRDGEDVPNLQELEEEGALVFVPLGGSSLALWTHRLASLNRPELHIFDRDEEPPRTSQHQEAADRINARQGAKALLTGKREMENYLHPDAITEALEIEIAHSDFADIPDLVAELLHVANGGQRDWHSLDASTRKSKISRAKRVLNNRAVRSMSAERLTAIDGAGDVRSWLAEIQAMLAQ